ncbi:MAG: hypothetical protein IPG45_04950 [Deltaproteobacteria bacterium]|nr:hypothetical protein [Deltaproteobacteria bacterium]
MRCPSCHRAYAATERVCPKDGATLLEPLDVGLRRGPWALSQTVKVLDRLLAELEPLHATGRCHGRLQPAAVLVHQLGGAVTVQLVPASAIDPPAAEYQPPELSGGQAAHDKSDLYAVGLLAHHLLAGRPPFRHAQPTEVQAQQRSAPPPSLLGLALQDVPNELDDLIRRLLAKDPAQRPRGPGEVRDLLANLELDSTVMGERLKALTGEVGLGAVVPEVQEELGEAATLPPSGPNIPAFGDGFSEVDPFADTWVRGLRRDALDTEPDTVAPTGRSPGPLVGRVPAPGPSLDADTTIDPVDPATARGTFQTLPEPGTTGPKWWWIVAASALLGVSAVGAYWFFQ